jgi:RimJ/RimL family protein N-acetyltransferase
MSGGATAARRQRERVERTRLRVVDYDERFLEASFRWFHADPELCRLSMVEPPTRDEQRAWYQRMADDPTYRVWGVELDGEPVGVFGINNIADGRGRYFAFVGERDHWGLGIGHVFAEEVIRRGRELGLRTLWGVVLQDNARSIGLQMRHGFHIVREADGLVWIERDL